jgi:alpha-beta hydrolase superfamily lysophospholipase
MADSATFPVPAPDGITLVGRHWALPDGVTRRGAVLIVHGLGKQSGRYSHVADALHAVGLDVRSCDQRGFGLSDGPRERLPWQDALLGNAQLRFERWPAAIQSCPRRPRAPWPIGSPGRRNRQVVPGAVPRDLQRVRSRARRSWQTCRTG